MKTSLSENITLNFLIKIISYVFAFVTVLYVTRILQPELFGKVSFAESVSGWFVLFAALGIPIYGIRACAEHKNDREKLNKIFNELFSLNLLFALISTVFYLSIIFLIPCLRSNMSLLVIYGLGIIFQTIGCEWLFRGLEKFRLLTLSSFLIKAVSLICIILFVHSGKDFLLYAFFAVFAACGTSLICMFNLKKFVDFSFKFKINTEHLKPLFIFFIMACEVTIYNSLDITMLGFMTDDYLTGIYTASSKAKIFLAMAGGIVWNALLPRATHLWKTGQKANFVRLAEKSITGVFLVQILATIFCFIFAKEIILIVGGASYLGGVRAFRILLLSLLPIGFSNILGGQVIIPAGLEKRLLNAEITGAVFNFLANLIAVPMFSISGAAATTVISEVIVWLLCVHYIKKDLKVDFGLIIIKRMYVISKRFIDEKRLRFEEKFIKEKTPFYCPCCDLKLKKFIKGNYKNNGNFFDKRRYENIDGNVLCPLCSSLPRHRILVTYLQEHKEEIKDYKILHFAQEESVRMWFERNDIKYTSADLTKTADLKLNLEDTGLESNSCDMIICNHVLEHVSDYRKALAELRRIIKPGKKIIISFPVDLSYDEVYEDKTITKGKDRINAFGQYDHLRVFGKKSKEMLEKAGFEVEEIKGEYCDEKIKPTVGPGDYDYNVLYVLKRKGLT